MSLRIPLTSDQTLQVEFHEIERRLRKLEKATGTTASTSIIRVSGGGGGSTVNLQPILDRLEALELQVAEIPVDEEVPDFKPVGSTAANGLVPSPGTAEPPTGVAQHVLTEDNLWGFPFRGLVEVTTPGDETGDGSDTLDVDGSLHVAGGLSTHRIMAVNVVVLGALILPGYLACCEDDLSVAGLI